MRPRLILAVRQLEYAAKLAAYIREQEPGWEVAAFTHVPALRRELQEYARRVDVLIGEQQMLVEAEVADDAASTIYVFADNRGEARSSWTALVRYQPLPALLMAIREGMGRQTAAMAQGCRTITLFSASGGGGKTTAALNIARQAGERGQRVFYLNLEPLNATSLWFGQGETDNLSQLLYAMQAHPAQWLDRFHELRRSAWQLRSDYLDAPDRPGERLALEADDMIKLVEGIRGCERYDLVIIDPDSGAGGWHRTLLEISDAFVWLVDDDLQHMKKAELLLSDWQAANDQLKQPIFIRNRLQSQKLRNQTCLPLTDCGLPYIQEWTRLMEPMQVLQSPVYSSAIAELLALLGFVKGARTG